MGSDRMHKLENIYIKNSLANTNKASLPPKASGHGHGIPRADSLTNEAISALRRHGKKPDNVGLIYKNVGAS